MNQNENAITLPGYAPYRFSPSAATNQQNSVRDAAQLSQFQIIAFSGAIE